MKNIKIKALISGALSTLILTSTAAMAETNSISKLDNNNNAGIMAYQPPYVSSFKIVGYSDSVYFTRGTSTFNDLFAVNSANSTYDAFYWADDGAATIYLGTEQYGYGAGNPSTFLDGSSSDLSYNDIYFNGDIQHQLDIKSFSNIPQGYHTLKMVIVNPDISAPISVLTSSIKLRVNSLSSYSLTSSIPVNTELDWSMPKQVASGVNLNNYVGVFDVNTGEQVAASIGLAADNQTIVINPPSGQYTKNSDYELVINPGIKFADGSESFEATIIDFSTNATVQANAIKSSTTAASINGDNQSTTLNINADNSLNTKGIKTNSKDTLNFNNYIKYAHKLKK